MSLASCAHPSRPRTKTYAAPVYRAWFDVLTTAMDPETAALSPNQSPDSPSEAVSFASCVHVEPDFKNTYAAPVAPATPYAPATMVAPSMATELPKNPPSLSVSSALSDHSKSDLTNTYTAPQEHSMPPPVAPTATVVPEMATAQPNQSPSPPSDATILASIVHMGPDPEK